jgi:hypothetical protein
MIGLPARIAIAASLLALAACGGSDSDPAVTLSGTVSGLTTSGLALASNGVNLNIASGATTFTFGPILSDTVGYSVIVALQPSGQACTVANGSGTAGTANISNVVVTCSDRTFTVGGTISGLTASGLILANGSDTLSVPAGASTFTMPVGVAYGSSYAVKVAAQPAGLTCSVTGGTGTIATSAVTSVTVKCADPAPAVVGSVSGLGGATGLMLTNGADTVAVPANATSFTLATPQATGENYAVRVQSQPAGLTCSPGTAPGTMPTEDASEVSITCSEQAYSLGGSVTGLTAAGLVLSDGIDSYTLPAGAANFTMPTAIASGSRYAVRVRTRPAGLTCTVSGGTGTMAAAPVATVEVTCASSSYTLGGSISGLTASGLVLADGTDTLSVSANAARFSMPKALAYGSQYAVTIQAQPDGEACRIGEATGVLSGEVGTVRVSCEAAPAP